MSMKNMIRRMNEQQKAKKKDIYKKSVRRPEMLDYAEPTSSTVGANNMNKAYLEKQAKMTNKKVEELERELKNQDYILKNMVARQKGGMVSNESARTLEHNLSKGLGSKYMPGNVGDINKVIWPFWFTDSENGVILRPNQQAQGQVTITQEAAFIIVHYTKAVFAEEPDGEGGFNGQFTYIDPAQDDSSGKSNGLTMTIRDSQSSRSFFNLPININQIGHWRSPTVLNPPLMFLPNSNIEVTYSNNTQNTSYKVFVTMFGYRLRLDHAKDILSLVSG